MPNKAALREAAGGLESFRACFELPAPEGALYLTRTHPTVEGLASYVMDAALDPLLEGVARRSGVIRTRAVEVRTTLLLVRFRYHIVTRRGDPALSEAEGDEIALLAEDCQTLGFTGAPQAAQWLPSEQVESLLDAEPAANIGPQQASDFLRRVVEDFEPLREPLRGAAEARGEELLDAHRRVRSAARVKGVRYDVRPHLPPDVLGVYVLLPVVNGGILLA